MTNYTQKGWTPLYYAVESNAEECLKLLLSHGAKVNITNNVSNIIALTNTRTVYGLIVI